MSNVTQPKLKKTRMNMAKLCRRLQTVDDQVQFMISENLFPKTVQCKNCDTILENYKIRGNYVYFHCGLCKCNNNIRSGTFLEESRISLRRFILLSYSFVTTTMTYKQIQHEVTVTSGILFHYKS